MTRRGFAGRWWIWGSLVLWLGQVPGLGAAGLREFGDSWLIPAEDSWALLGPTDQPLKSLIDPEPAVVLSLGRTRLYSLPDLEQTWLAGLIRTRFLARDLQLKGEWQQLGADLFVENRVAMETTSGKSPGVGLQVARKAVSIAGDPVSSSLTCHLVLDYLGQLDEGTVLRCRLALPLVLAESEADFEYRREFLKLTIFKGAAALAVQVDRRFDGSPVLGFDFFWGPQDGWGVNLRIDPATGSLGPGIQLRRGILLLRSSHLVHPELGQTHRFALCLKYQRG